MALSPQRIRETRFKPARRGYDPAEVDTFLEEAAAALEAAQNDATAMEARARAAVARLQELSQAGDDAGATPRASVDESETISRTLLLAQRTADATVADAQAEAERVLATARDEATEGVAAANDEATRLVDEARLEARRAGESERVQVEGEVQALLARRDFLESDVDHLEQYLLAQKERITEAVHELTELCQRVPGGLGEMRRPLLSAAADEGADESVDAESADAEFAEITRVVEADDSERVAEGEDDAAEVPTEDAAPSSSSTDGESPARRDGVPR
jgi:DivIVA domain-containing protein